MFFALVSDLEVRLVRRQPVLYNRLNVKRRSAIFYLCVSVMIKDCYSILLLILHDIADKFGSYHVLVRKDPSLILVGKNLPGEKILSQYNVTTILYEIFHISIPLTLYEEEFNVSDYDISQTMIMLEIKDTKELESIDKYKLISDNIETIYAFFGVTTG